MAVRETTQKITVNLLLDNGTTTTGAVKTISQSIGAIDKNTYNAEKAMNIANLVSPCLAKSIYAVQQSTQAYIEE